MTAQELLAQAQRMAFLDGKEWHELTLSERASYGSAAHRLVQGRNTDGSIAFPSWVQPTYCMVQTITKVTHTNHGTVRVALSLPARPMYVCRSADNSVYSGRNMRFADQPCGPECVNR
jgi:hypothetical protein